MHSTSTAKESIYSLVTELLKEFYAFSLSDLSLLSDMTEEHLLSFLMEFVNAGLIQITISDFGRLMYEPS